MPCCLYPKHYEPLRIIKVIVLRYTENQLVGQQTKTRYGKRKVGERFYIREEDFDPALFKRATDA